MFLNNLKSTVVESATKTIEKQKIRWTLRNLIKLLKCKKFLRNYGYNMSIKDSYNFLNARVRNWEQFLNLLSNVEIHKKNVKYLQASTL